MFNISFFSHKSLKITQNRSNPPPSLVICFRSKFLLTKNKLNPLNIKYLRKNQKKTKLIFVLATALK